MSGERDPFADTWRSFFRERCADDLRALVAEYPGERSLHVDVLELYGFDESFTQALFDDPDRVLRTGREALRSLHESFERVNVRLTNHPGLLGIDGLRVRHVSELVSVEASVSTIDEIRAAVSLGVHRCAACGSLVRRRPLAHLCPPLRCPECGAEDAFELDQARSTFVDVQRITLDGNRDETDGAGVARLDAVIDDDLVGTLQAGEQVLVTGILRLEGQEPANRFDFYLDVNAVSHEPGEARPPIEDISNELRDAIESRWERLANR